jgi:hypothetical protein
MSRKLMGFFIAGTGSLCLIESVIAMLSSRKELYGVGSSLLRRHPSVYLLSVVFGPPVAVPCR